MDGGESLIKRMGAPGDRPRLRPLLRCAVGDESKGWRGGHAGSPVAEEMKAYLSNSRKQVCKICFLTVMLGPVPGESEHDVGRGRAYGWAWLIPGDFALRNSGDRRFAASSG
ncbi:hypothetical protein GCM10007276_34600 [Agaricicola taiwanensis]|uniref:Uncharacterized protein n=1 Tax=Agaricicola taiwanensis TaxID=591372 RepID=A0A8J2YMZ6_9RHOB|nr:hypothetical protein GCM10007276_34600 [Agaricicola taiwanensis]